MQKLISGIIFSVVISAPVFADTTNLKEALEATYKNNAALAENRANLKSLDENLVSANSGLLPTVTGSYSASLSKDRNSSSTSDDITNSFYQSVSLSISQLIYDGGQTIASIDSAELALLAGRENLVLAEQQILLSAVTSYMDVRAAQATLNLAENNIKVLEEQVRASEDRFEVGEVTRTDVSQAQARLAAAISGRESSKAGLLGQIANYVALIGQEPHKLEAPFSTPAIPKNLASAEKRAMQNHPRVTAAQFGLMAAEVDVKIARKNKIPTVTGNLSGTVANGTDFDSGFSSPTSSVSVGLSATLPIYQGGKLDSARRRAAAALDSEQLQLRQAIETTRTNLRISYYNWIAAKAAITARQQQIRASKIAFEGVQEEAKFGARTTLDVLDAEQDLLSARSELVTALRDEQVRAYSVLSEMGELTAKALGLNVELYDPAKAASKIQQDSPLGFRRVNLLEKLQKRR